MTQEKPLPTLANSNIFKGPANVSAKKDHFVSIIIPAYNEELYLEKCLASLREMDYDATNYEVIIVDNGSTDCTSLVALRFGASVISFPQGTTIAQVRNEGARIARGNIFAFLDADCVVSKHWLANAVGCLSGGIGCVGARPVAPEVGATWVERCWGLILPRSLRDAIFVDWLSSSNLIVAGTLFRAIRGFDERLATGEDVDFGLRLSKITKVLYDPKVQAFHLKEPKTLSNFIRKEIWHGKSNLRGFVLHGFPLNELLSVAVPFVFLAAFITLLVGVAISSLTIVLLSLSFLMLIPSIMTARNVKRVGISLMLLQCLAINTAYITGRSIAIFPSLIDLLSCKRADCR